MMEFDLHKTLEILERTPGILETLLGGLSPEWTAHTEGGESWSPYDVLGHLVHGEQTDWLPRMELILSDREDKTFEPFDRFAQFRQSKGKTAQQLLDEFRGLRTQNLEAVRARNLTPKELRLKGFHPSLGVVLLSELLAAWAVHDLNHLAQINRVMAWQYREAVGPWKAYLGILNS